MDACIKPIQIVDLVSESARNKGWVFVVGFWSQCISKAKGVSNPTNKNASIIQQAMDFFLNIIEKNQIQNHQLSSSPIEKKYDSPPFFWAAQLVDVIHPNVPPSPPLGARRNGNGLGGGGSRWNLLSTSTRSLGVENHHHASGRL